MAQSQLRPAPLAKVAGLGNLLSSAERNSEYSPSLHLRQAEIDPVIILAARARVAIPTMRVHAELFGIGGRAHG